MTPQQLTDYKNIWMSQGAFSVPFHSDYHSQALDWCKLYCERREYVFRKHTGVYEHTIFFENKQQAALFKAEFGL